MSMIKPKPKSVKETVHLRVDGNILNEVREYCRYQEFAKIEEFFIEAACHILLNDKQFKKWQEQQPVV